MKGAVAKDSGAADHVVSDLMLPNGKLQSSSTNNWSRQEAAGEPTNYRGDNLFRDKWRNSPLHCALGARVVNLCTPTGKVVHVGNGVVLDENDFMLG